MLQNYLNGLHYEKCDESDPKLTGVYVIEERNAYYYISTYKTLGNRKEYFFRLLSDHQKEVKREWELHHIVESQHLKPFYTDAQILYLYNNVWPCILIHKEEHYAYNSLLHSKETKLLFGINSNMPKSSLLNNVASMYREAYQGNYILSKIAENVLRGVAAY
jgi:hypothetical protein